MATYCNAPTSVQVSNSLMIPGEGVLLSWSGASAGTDNPILGYLIQFRDNTGAEWEEYCTVLTDLTSYMTTVVVPTIRGTYRYWRVTTLGINDNSVVGTKTYSTIVSSKSNRLPFSPSVTLNKTEIPYNGSTENKTVTFTIVANTTADDVGETQVFAYSVSLEGEKIAILNGGTVTIDATTTFYVWSFDGLEYCTTPTQRVVTKNTLPSITGLVSTPFFSTVGPNSKILTTKVTMTPTASNSLGHALKSSYRFEYSATLDFASPIIGDYIEGSLVPASTLITSVGNNGKYFKVRVKITDQIFTTDYSEQLDSTIYYMPKLPDAYGGNIILRPLHAQTLAPMTDYTLGGINYYRHWFQYGCSSFSANNIDGYGVITLVKAYFNMNPSIATTINPTAGVVPETLINYTVYSEDTAPSTISAQIAVRDEFGQEQILNTGIIVKNLTKINDVLIVTNAVSYSGTTIAGKTGLAVYDIDEFNLSFGNLKNSYPNSFNYNDFDTTQISMYQKLTFLSNNQIINNNDFDPDIDGGLITTLRVKTRTTFGAGSTTGLLNAVTRLINTATNDSNFIIHIYDHFGIVHQLKLAIPVNIDFRATPKRINNTVGLVNIASPNWINPFTLTDEFYGVYKDQVLTLKFNSLVFGDANLDNGAFESIKVKIYIYENSIPIKTIDTTWDANSTISTYNLPLDESNLGPIANIREIEIKLSAYDNTLLESSSATQYKIGNFVIFLKSIPTISLTQLTYAVDGGDDVINASYNYSYDVLNNLYTSAFQTVYNVKNITMSLNNFAPLLGTPEVISLMSGIVPVGSSTVVDGLAFTLGAGVDKQTITPVLTITVTYHDNTTKTIVSNIRKLKFGEPTMSLRKNQVSFNKEFEDITVGTDGVLYIHSESTTITKVYLTYAYNTESHVMAIDLKTGEINDAIIDGGTY